MVSGQEKVYDLINKFDLSTLPHSILLIGEEGSGQNDICRYITEKFSLLDLDLTGNLSHEFIDKIYLSGGNPTLYTLNLNKITEKDQNILLKLYEEPNPFTYIILLGENTSTLLETIITRSYQINLCRYTPDQLSKYLDEGDDPLILKVCHTPGQVEIAKHTDIKSLYFLCQNIIERINKANYFNTLTISDKINFKDEYSKFDLKLFIRMLSYVMIEKKDYRFYKPINKFLKYVDFMIDKKSYFENLLTDIWEISRSEH